MADDSLTPIRRQYLELKARHPGAILFFRLGDFYETFDEDAETVARELDIALTSRPMGKLGRVPLAGVPYHAADSYLARLIGKGYRVAICEQLEDPRSVKGIVPRGVVRVVSPGTVMEPDLLESERNNYLASYRPPSGAETSAGLAYIDITTSEFAVTQVPVDRVPHELERLAPAEVLVPKNAVLPWASPGPLRTEVEPVWFDPEAGRAALQAHFHVATLEGFGCDNLPPALGAAGAVLEYLKENQPASLAQVTRLVTYSPDAWMQIDRQTRRNLELFARNREGSGQGTLLSALDRTRTAMGKRLLRRWLDQPLVARGPLEERLSAVEWFVERRAARSDGMSLLGRMPDLERLLNRVRGGRATPRDLVALLRGLDTLPALSTVLAGAPRALTEGLDVPGMGDLPALLRAAISDDPPASLEDGAVIRDGFSPELDQLRERVRDGQQAVLDMERRERERTGIKSLKVGYNRVFGYYFEVTNAHRRLVPQDYLRKQTLVGAERFFTAELKAQETAVLAAQERIAEVEVELFRRVCGQVSGYGEHVLAAAEAVARVDVHAGMATAAAENGYVRPALDDGDLLQIKEGRHPVVERELPNGAFVPNDTDLGSGGCQIALITGPNMSGKSTYLRQVALIVLMAQIGSFVPARSALVGIVDRIFSRIGAQDDLATGQSTFMVEMAETAHILRHASSRSLVILDELGRGTSTYDGLSIAQAVVEYLHQDPRANPKTLFATHYHELTSLAKSLPGVRNLTFAVAEHEGELAFLRRLIPGGADQSYGVHVARLAGLPASVTRRAEELLRTMERGSKGGAAGGAAMPRRVTAPSAQIPLWNGNGELVEALTAMDLDAMTPLEALTALYELQAKITAHT